MSTSEPGTRPLARILSGCSVHSVTEEGVTVTVGVSIGVGVRAAVGVGDNEGVGVGPVEDGVGADVAVADCDAV